ncbi:RNA-binding protein Jag [Olavius algarvensis associated proteobacterium Delta 3]|nr:RNA-binding protein Jag [Olavius algarvensis associated proteobacterium Delta 3]CAB5146142.1 RNA-binding protein Jag [Olavius algarvensis associated proteobacterium Delta 3]
MAPFLEYEGKSIDSAVQKACEDLNISRDRIQYDIISYGSTGIFGIVGAKEAKIRVVRDGSGDPEETGAKMDSAAEDTPAKNGNAPLEEEKRPARAPIDPALVEAAVNKGREALEHIVAHITEGTRIAVETDDERILFNVSGGNAAVLIGKRGQTLEAIQYLVDKVVNRQHEYRLRIQIDVEDYMKTRRANLRDLAERLAEKSKRTGKPVTLGQMNAHDRRVVHLALKNDRGVRTQSRGDGFYRKLIIFPKKGNPRKRRPRQQRSG